MSITVAKILFVVFFNRHADALINFDESFRNLRGSKFIDYKQLGMRYKLFKCEVNNCHT